LGRAEGGPLVLSGRAELEKLGGLGRAGLTYRSTVNEVGPPPS